MKAESISIITQYLLNHENDIESGTKDFAQLREVFEDLVGRKPEKDKPMTYTYGHFPS